MVEIIVYLWAVYGSRLDKNYDDEIINPKGVISSPYKIVLKKTKIFPYLVFYIHT